MTDIKLNLINLKFYTKLSWF